MLRFEANPLFPAAMKFVLLALSVATSVHAVTPIDQIKVPPGFKVELLKEAGERDGSWICMAMDGDGRLYISPQGSIPETGFAKDSAWGGLVRATVGEKGVEKWERVPVPVGDAMGMLWAFDSLYVSGQGPEGRGIYRCKDTNGDSIPDEAKLWKAVPGGAGEHGAHALVLGPDGKSIYIVHGNSTPLISDVAADSPYSGWGEDDLLPKLKDPVATFFDKLKAPYGYVLRTDENGIKWELYAGGFRNPYDLDFNPDGELFTYDSDMEWDRGLPWYRPTRVLHVIPGGEYGFREGSAKWPDWYPDSLPPVVDVGLGCPTGAKFGTNAKGWPEKYRKAFFICDWTFGRLLAVHMKEKGASYAAANPLKSYTYPKDAEASGDVESFLSGKGLPLTDVEIGKDGSMYLTVGGRGTQAGLYRVRWAGPEVPAKSEEEIANAESDRLIRVTSRKGALGSRERFSRSEFTDPFKNLEKRTSFVADGGESSDPFAGFAFLRDLNDQLKPEHLEDALKSVGGSREDATPVRITVPKDPVVLKKEIERLEKEIADAKDDTVEVKLRFELASIRAAYKIVIGEEPPGARALLPKGVAAVQDRRQVEIKEAQERIQRLKEQLDERRKAMIAKGGEVDSELLRLEQEYASARIELKLGNEFPQELKRPSETELSREKLRLLTAVSRNPSGDIQPKILESLKSYPFSKLDSEFKVLKLRIVELTFARHGRPSEEWVRTGLKKLMAQYPAKGPEAAKLNRELCQLLVWLSNPALGDDASLGNIGKRDSVGPAPNPGANVHLDRKGAAFHAELGQQIIERTLTLMDAAPSQEEQIYYVLCLRWAHGWTPQQRERYFRWFHEKAVRYTGGNSFAKFVDKIRADAASRVPEADRTALSPWLGAMASADPQKSKAQEVKPRAFVKAWTLADLEPALDALRDRKPDLARGKQLYTEAQCAQCHLFRDGGGNVGPDLTAVAQRFGRKDILEAILDPNKAVSDQYAMITLTVRKGGGGEDQVSGLIQEETSATITLLIDPLSGRTGNYYTNVVNKREKANVSIMPPALLNTLTMEEVADLLAYLGAK